MKKKFILLSLLIAAVCTASATITKTIGTGGAPTYDYASLHEASLDLYNNPLTEDMVWEICTDLTETINTGIINNTEFSLTIRPDADADRTVTYTTSADNDGPSGNFVIGGIPKAIQAENIPFVTEPAKNVTIDGAFDGGSTRRLTFTTNTAGGITMVVYGNVTNTVIKNCRLINTRTSGTNFALVIRTERNTDNHPVGLLVDNCYLQATGSANCQVIYFNGSQRSTADGLIENTTINDCEIVAALRGIFFNGAKNANILGCTFRLASASPGFLAHGIMGNVQSGIINVKGCKFLELKTNNVNAGDFGIQGITASGGATVWNIENNIFTGLDALASGVSTKAIKLCAVRCGDPCVVRHNTFVMPTLTNVPTTAVMSTTPISLLYLAGTTNTVQNNIFVSHETVANHSLIRGSMNAQCKGNKFYHEGGNAYVVAGNDALCQDWDAVESNYPAQAASSKWVNVAFDSDMMLDGASRTDANLAVMPVDGITTDILGVTRNTPTYAGVEDPGLFDFYNLYEIGTNQTNGWNATEGTPLEVIDVKVYKGYFDFAANSYFAFVSDLAMVNDTEGWNYVNSLRYAGDVDDKVLTDGSNEDLVKVNRAFKVEEAGRYAITVNLNTNKIQVVKIYADDLYEIGDNQGEWHANVGVPMTKIEDNIFEGDFTFTNPLNHFAFATAMANQDDTQAWDWLNANVRYAGATDNEVLDNGTNTTIVKGNRSYEILPGVYTIRVNMHDATVSVTQSAAKVIVTDAGYATYYNGVKAYTMPTGMTGYAFNATEGLVEAYSAGEVVPAGFPLVLEAEAGTYDLVFTEGGVAAEVTSQLHGTDAAATTVAPDEGDYKFYGLSLDAEPNNTAASVGFYYMAADGAAFTNAAHKAYLAVPVVAGAAPRYLFHGENGATNIENIEANDAAVKFIENGQLFIRKNGVTYDALGRIVR